MRGNHKVIALIREQRRDSKASLRALQEVEVADSSSIEDQDKLGLKAGLKKLRTIRTEHQGLQRKVRLDQDRLRLEGKLLDLRLQLIVTQQRVERLEVGKPATELNAMPFENDSEEEMTSAVHQMRMDELADSTLQDVAKESILERPRRLSKFQEQLDDPLDAPRNVETVPPADAIIPDSDRNAFKAGDEVPDLTEDVKPMFVEDSTAAIPIKLASNGVPPQLPFQQSDIELDAVDHLIIKYTYLTEQHLLDFRKVAGQC